MQTHDNRATLCRASRRPGEPASTFVVSPRTSCPRAQVVIRVRPPLERELHGYHEFQRCVLVEDSSPARHITISENLAGKHAADTAVGAGDARGGQEGRHVRRGVRRAPAALTDPLSGIDPSMYATYSFAFDRVFDQMSTQADVYAQAARPAVMSCLEGYNAAIIAYGQVTWSSRHVPPLHHLPKALHNDLASLPPIASLPPRSHRDPEVALCLLPGLPVLQPRAALARLPRRPGPARRTRWRGRTCAGSTGASSRVQSRTSSATSRTTASPSGPSSLSERRICRRVLCFMLCHDGAALCCNCKRAAGASKPLLCCIGDSQQLRV